MVYQSPCGWPVILQIGRLLSHSLSHSFNQSKMNYFVLQDTLEFSTYLIPHFLQVRLATDQVESTLRLTLRSFQQRTYFLLLWNVLLSCLIGELQFVYV